MDGVGEVTRAEQGAETKEQASLPEGLREMSDGRWACEVAGQDQSARN